MKTFVASSYLLLHVCTDTMIGPRYCHHPFSRTAREAGNEYLSNASNYQDDTSGQSAHKDLPHCATGRWSARESAAVTLFRGAIGTGNAQRRGSWTKSNRAHSATTSRHSEAPRH